MMAGQRLRFPCPRCGAMSNAAMRAAVPQTSAGPVPEADRLRVDRVRPGGADTIVS